MAKVGTGTDLAEGEAPLAAETSNESAGGGSGGETALTITGGKSKPRDGATQGNKSPQKKTEELSTRVIFLPGRKNNAIRRYWAILFFFTAASALFIGLFSGYWSTSVAPVLELNSAEPGTFEKMTCRVTSRRLEHDVSVGIHSVWRGEVTVAYLDGNNDTLTATIHDHITGVYGSRTVATEFLLSHTVGKEIDCYVNPSAPFYAASVRPQIVYSGVVFICCLLGTLSLVSLVLVGVTLKSFSHFLSSYLWDEEKGVWVEVKGSL